MARRPHFHGVLGWVLPVLLAGCSRETAESERVGEIAVREPSLDVNAQFAALSNEGVAVDPSLTGIREQLLREGFHFTSYRLLSSARVELRMNHSTDVEAPRAKTPQARLTLQGMAGGKADVRVEIANVDTTYQLGEEGPVVINYGTNGGELYMVLSPSPRPSRGAPPRAPSERRKRPDERR